MRVCSTGIVTSASKMEASCRAVCLNRISMSPLYRRGYEPIQLALGVSRAAAGL